MTKGMQSDDLLNVGNPLVSVLTPSLNHGRFLRQTIESVATQTYRNFEHIVIDGGSTDETVSILKEYPHVRWASEKDKNILEAYCKGLAMVRGKYVFQCCVSDGFLDRNWFRKCVEVLDKDEDVSLVWGFAQTMSEEGDLLNVCFQQFFTDPPPQKQEFLAYWLATGFPLPEGNYCVRSEIIKKWFPDENSEQWLQACELLGFMYNFFTQGHSPYFIPVVANFGRQHHDQRSEQLKKVLMPSIAEYSRNTKQYAVRVLKGEVRHLFRNGHGEVIGQLKPNDLGSLRRQIWRHRLMSSLLMRCDLYTIAKGLWRSIHQRVVG